MQINWSEHAIDDLREIVSYVGTSFGRRKAEDVFAEIRHTAELLKDFPMLGKSFVEDKELGIAYRTVPSKLNQMVYYIDGDAIIIVAVWQNRRDIRRLKSFLKQKPLLS